MSSETTTTFEPNNESQTKPENQKSTELTAPDTRAHPSDSHQMFFRNSIDGQLALLVEDNVTDMWAIPLNLYNKKGKVVLSVEHTPKVKIWGAKFGQWVIPEHTIMRSAEYPLGFGVLVSTNKLLVSKRMYSSKGSNCSVLLIRNSSGVLVFAAKEEVNFNRQNYFGRGRQIDIKVLDAFKREIVFCRQLLRFTACMSSCCMQCMQVMAQPSKNIGTVHQRCKLIGTEFVVNDNQKNQLFRVKSKGLQFDIFSMDNKTIGNIKKALKADNPFSPKEIPILSLEIIENIDPIKKSLLMSVVFLIKSLYF